MVGSDKLKRIIIALIACFFSYLNSINLSINQQITEPPFHKPTEN